MDTITAVSEQVHDEIDRLGLNPTQHGIYDNEDLICFALHYLQFNLEDAMPDLEGGTYER